MNHQHPKLPGCLLKMPIPRLPSRLTELGERVLDSIFYQTHWVILTDSQFGGYPRFTWAKDLDFTIRRALPRNRVLHPQPYTAARNAKGFNRMEQQFDSFL